MRVLHLTAVGKLNHGVRLQLEYEAKAAGELSGHSWDVLCLHNGKPMNSFEHCYPKFFGLPLLRNLYAWWNLLKLKQDYDLVIQRYMTVDPFQIVFSPFISNRFSVHHSKEIAELRLLKPGLVGHLAAMVEKVLGPLNLRFARGAVGVTQEIAGYQQSLLGGPLVTLVYPNGIDCSEFDALPDHRGGSVKLAFVASRFLPWHGLESLLTAVQSSQDSQQAVELFLVGELSEPQLEQVGRISRDSFQIHCCGHLQQAEISGVLSVCDLGLGSFELMRQGLTEACTLKVREYLAQGVPVYAGHRDSALPDDFVFFRSGAVEVTDIIAFALEMRGYSRASIIERSEVYIEKTKIMQRLVSQLANEPHR